MTFSIREIREDDFPTLIQLFNEFALFEKLPDKMQNSVERMISEKAYFHGFVAVSELDEIVGYVTYFYAYYTWVGKSMYLDDLYVLQKYRGSGIGTRLIHTIIDLAKSNGCHRLRWQVSGWNHPAIGFYENLGATVDGTESNCDLVLD